MRLNTKPEEVAMYHVIFYKNTIVIPIVKTGQRKFSPKGKAIQDAYPTVHSSILERQCKCTLRA